MKGGGYRMTVEEAISMIEYRIKTASDIAADNGAFDDLRMAIEIMKKQAYINEKIIKQLEEASWQTEPTYDCDGYSYDNERDVIDLDDAIDIVKRRGDE